MKKIATLLLAVGIAASSYGQACNTKFVTDFDNEAELPFITTTGMGGASSTGSAVISIANSELVIETEGGHEEDAKITIKPNDLTDSTLVEFDYENDSVKVQLRVKASDTMALRVTIVGENGVPAQNNNLQAATDWDNDGNVFDFLVTPEFQVLTVNFTLPLNVLWDEWTGSGAIYCPEGSSDCDAASSPIKFIELRPNPFFSQFPVLDQTDPFEGTLTVEYISLGELPVDSCFIENPDAVNATLLDEAAFKVFPVPTSEQLNIEVAEARDGKIEIFDLVGTKVAETTYNGGIETINVSELNADTYLVKFSNEEKVGFRKVQIND